MDRQVPLISFILVNWHTEDLLPRALASISAQNLPDYETILVDNCSPEFREEDYSGYSNLRIIRNARNLGFAAANNQALAIAQGDMVVLLNCDACLDENFCEAAWLAMKSDRQIGTVVAKILADDESGRIDSAGHVMYADRTTTHIGKGEMDCGQFDQPSYLFGGTAAAVAYRRLMLDEIAVSGKVFDETFFAYYEDVDLDWRAQLAGWRAFYEPRCVAWHRGHGSGGRASLKIQLLAEKNRYLMIIKNDSPVAQLKAVVPLLMYEIWHLAKTLLKPWLWPSIFLFLWHLPSALADRAVIQRGRSRTPEHVARQFRPRGLQPPATPVCVQIGVENLVSAVVVNFNGLELTRRCIKSLLAQDYSPLEIVIVDNNSSGNEAEKLAREFPDARVIRLNQNHGFSGGVNWGVTVARGEQIALVNNDAVLHRSCISRLVECQCSTGAGAVSGRLVDVPTQAFADEALHAVSDELNGRDPRLGGLSTTVERAMAESMRNHGLSYCGMIVEDAFSNIPESFYPSGGLCLLNRKSFDDLLPEMFPHFYFAYHEDVWLGFALRSRGATVAKAVDAVGVHVASSTARTLGRMRLRFLMERNRWLNLLGFLPAGILQRMAPVYLTGQLAMLAGMLVKGPGDFIGWLGAHIWIAAHPGDILRWRKICRSRQQSNGSSWLSRLSGKIRGRRGWLNGFSLKWCRNVGITCIEDEVLQSQGKELQ